MKKKILISSISSDSHTWNLVYMQLLCEELGYEVINIGNCIPMEYLIQKTHYHKPDLLIISTVNGHGHIEAMQIIKEIKKYDMLKNMKAIIGGKLGTMGENNQQYTQKLLDEGFDQVFSGDNAVENFVTYMNGSLKKVVNF